VARFGGWKDQRKGETWRLAPPFLTLLPYNTGVYVLSSFFDYRGQWTIGLPARTEPFLPDLRFLPFSPSSQSDLMSRFLGHLSSQDVDQVSSERGPSHDLRALCQTKHMDCEMASATRASPSPVLQLEET
jgi:hypothetical protein